MKSILTFLLICLFNSTLHAQSDFVHIYNMPHQIVYFGSKVEIDAELSTISRDILNEKIAEYLPTLMMVSIIPDSVVTKNTAINTYLKEILTDLKYGKRKKDIYIEEELRNYLKENGISKLLVFTNFGHVKSPNGIQKERVKDATFAFIRGFGDDGKNVSIRSCDMYSFELDAITNKITFYNFVLDDAGPQNKIAMKLQLKDLMAAYFRNKKK
jgi:hypothetical protein